MRFQTKFFCIISFVILGLFFSCDKDKKIKPVPETGTVTDIEDNTYKTVKIGNKWWMAENLKVKKFRNGSAIPVAQTNADWLMGSAACCLFDNNSTAPGLLYNWFAVERADDIAPEGWHVATEADWKDLERTMGMPDSLIDKLNWREPGVCGDKLKIKAPTGWTNYAPIWGTNESGFTALAGGCRLPEGKWATPGLFATGFWWTSTGNDSNSAWFRQLDYKKSGVFRYFVSKKYGMSVRCVKD